MSPCTPSTSNGESARITCARGLCSRSTPRPRRRPRDRRCVDLVHDADVGHAQVGLARVVARLVPRPVRVDDDEVQVRPDERRVVVAAVPEDHVGLLLGRVEDRRVVDPGEDDVALGQVRLVLLALLDRAVVGGEVLVAAEALDGLLRQVAVRHRMGRTATRCPWSRRICATRRVVWLLPEPVRTAQTATTGRERRASSGSARAAGSSRRRRARASPRASRARA